MSKIFSYQDLLTKDLKLEGDIILVGGCFDVFHYGHLIFLKRAKMLGGKLTVALESDKFILKKKKRKPVHTQNQRAEILAGLVVVDLIIKLPYFASNQDYLNLVKMVKPKFIAVSDNDPLTAIKKKQAAVVGGELRVVCKHQADFSSTQIINRNKIDNGNYYC